MKRHLASLLAVAVAIAGCASQQHSVISSSTTTPTRSVAAQNRSSGWYLMQPPIGHGNHVDNSAKLADWQALAFFDRASQCDAAREQGLSANDSYLPVSTSGAMDSVQMSQRLASSTLCVAADDPRINWFHFQWK